MFRNSALIAFAASCLLVLAGCISEEYKAELIEESDGQGNAAVDDNNDLEDELSCAAIELALAADLPISEATAQNLYEPLTFGEWCEQNILDDDLEDFVGNARLWKADETDTQITRTSFSGRATRPTLAQGARLDLHVLEPQGTIPFIRKIHFADWEGPNGTCALEMRVYQENIGETGKKPLLYFHGGGWKHRTTTMTAAEVPTRYLVENHVVFMPAYPLHLAKDGPQECRQAAFNDILGIAQQAFEWVVTNKDAFGATGAEQVDVMGHSAGAQLAAYVGTGNRDRTGKLVNFYGPTEFADFIDEARPGGDYAETFDSSRALLASLLEVENLDDLQRPYVDVVMQNSLSELIAREGAGAVPPFFMIQGNVDQTVPVRQALLACNALGGDASEEGGMYSCANASHVVILDNAGHNLDRRCAGGDWPGDDSDDPDTMMETICPDEEGVDEVVADAVRTAFDWLGS
ncbi:MAG: alpha/beta hydrolase [Proteobacteria bacterium]|nr:alpha/beta hydrolase [Pseudomonadota bacterium]